MDPSWNVLTIEYFVRLAWPDGWRPDVCLVQPVPCGLNDVVGHCHDKSFFLLLSILFLFMIVCGEELARLVDEYIFF